MQGNIESINFGLFLKLKLNISGTPYLNELIFLQFTLYYKTQLLVTKAMMKLFFFLCYFNVQHFKKLLYFSKTDFFVPKFFRMIRKKININGTLSDGVS